MLKLALIFSAALILSGNIFPLHVSAARIISKISFDESN